MPARRPEELNELFVEAVNAGNLEMLMTLYEPHASVVRPGQVLTGTVAIREAMRGLLARKPRFAAEPKPTLQAGDLALTGARWTMEATGPEGLTATRSGHSAEVARRQPDGTWRFVLDNPFVAE